MNAVTDWSTLPLDGAGRSLIQASAGTGKTWTIGVLYLRLLLEQKLTPRQIIVSTFTNAAAAELRERLRSRLVQALALVDDPDAGSELDWLHARWQDDDAQRKADGEQLRTALAEFDAAPVSTLHRLCSRILADHPFASGTLFNGREIVDDRALRQALIDDLWRVCDQSQGDESPLPALAATAQLTRKKLEHYVPVLLQPGVAVGVEDDALRQEVLAILGNADTWVKRTRELLDEGVFRKGSNLGKALIALADALEGKGDALGEVLNTYHASLHEAGEKAVINGKGQGRADVDALVQQARMLARGISSISLDIATCPALRAFLATAQSWCRQTLQQRLDAANQTTFDELLLTVHAAITSPSRTLADALFHAWPVALVDEFQDTDPVQYGILDAIYRDAENQLRGRLVMIGDPKQSIYRFRGGDIATYQRAAATATESLVLDTNHRSSRDFVAAINAFYGDDHDGRRKLGPMESDTPIEYIPVQASARRDDQPLTRGTDDTPVTAPLVLHVLSADCDSDDMQRDALEACAGEIAHALSTEGYRIAGKPVQPSDIAVLLPSHAQIEQLSQLLKRRGIPSVARSDVSVFQSDSARELRLILHAALHPDDPRAIRAALSTRILGWNLSDLREADGQSARWDAEVNRFHALSRTLAHAGPQTLVDELLDQRASDLLDLFEGERILTDLRHLGELLQEAHASGGGERLAAWFTHQIAGDAALAEDADARALRLESDAGRVQLMTLHGSKGLEFPLVFLPLMWKHGISHAARSSAALLGRSDGSKMLALGPARKDVEAQELDERYRMLYVALTRAIHACHLYLLPDGTASDAIEKARKSKSDAPLNQLTASLLANAIDPDGPIERCHGWSRHDRAQPRIVNAAPVTGRARTLPAPPSGPLPMRHSFSTLASGLHHVAGPEDGAADDESMARAEAIETVREDTRTPHLALDALANVAGTDFGNAVHAVFERRVPGLPLADQQALLREQIAEYAVAAGDDAETLAAALQQRLQVVLDTPLGDANGPVLATLPANALLAEMEFNYVLHDLPLTRLRALCEQHGEPDLMPQREQILAGLMNGKIDLVFAHDGAFHVLDYKSNRLGDALEDYAPAALETAMQASGYRLQALLYTLAVERYLRERLGENYRRERHLGDCWYLFVRAVGLALPDGTPCGVWHHRFDDALLDALQQAIATPGATP